MSVKSEVLSILKENENFLTSGEVISHRINCSRMSVSKAVKSLKEEGYLIITIKSKGYMLVSGSDILSEEELKKDLLPYTFPVFIFDELESTNQTVKSKLLENVSSPFLVAAKRQTGGKGRKGRSFFSPEGGVYFSVAIPEEEISSPTLITISAALAVSRVMTRLTGQETNIKWVNDVYLNGKKVTGILSEGVVNLEEGGLKDVIVGIGINLAIKDSAWPIELRNKATSFYKDGKSKIPRSLVISEVVKELLRIQKEDFINEYRKKCFIVGREVKLINFKDQNEIDVKVTGISDTGALIVKDKEGNEKEIYSGEVSVKL